MGVMGQRWEGFLSACIASGIDPSQIAVVETLISYEDGQALGRRLRKDHPDVTAVFATADSLAIGILAGLNEAGVRVPEDISVIGFDNIEMSALVTPGLTTVAQDIQAKGAEAARLVLQEVEKGQGTPPPISLEVSLVTRASVASPRTSQGT
jgi:LacI family transcriptional regulator